MAAISQQSSFQTVSLAAGRHDLPGREVCIMELASMLAGERFSDHPRSVCPVLAGIFRSYNDWLDDTRRPDLYGFASRAVGTRGDHALEVQRATMAIEWGRREYLRRSRGLFALRRKCRPPRPDDAPDEIGSYVVSALGRRIRDDAHQRVLVLFGELIELSASTATALDFDQSAELAIGIACEAVATPLAELTHEYMLPPLSDVQREPAPEPAPAPEPQPALVPPVLRTRRRARSPHPFAHFASSVAF
jgi:hypothetical protein